MAVFIISFALIGAVFCFATWTLGFNYTLCEAIVTFSKLNLSFIKFKHEFWGAFRLNFVFVVYFIRSFCSFNYKELYCTTLHARVLKSLHCPCLERINLGPRKLNSLVVFNVFILLNHGIYILIWSICWFEF